MMMNILLKRRVLPVVCVLLAATTLGGCVTDAKVKEMLAAFAQEQGLEVTRTSVQDNESKIAEIDARLAKLDELAARADKITADLAAASGKIAALESLATKVAALEQSQADQETRTAQLRKDADAARTARAELVVAVARAAIKDDVDQQFKNVDKTVAKLDTDTRALEAKDTQMGKDLKTLQQQAGALVTDLKTLKDFAAKLDADMQALTKTTTTAMAAQNKKIASIGSGMSGILSKEIEMLEGRITALKAALKNIDGAGAGGNGEAPSP